MEERLRYRLITGKDDSRFCQRISRLLEEGYRLYGSPSLACNGTDVIAAQAVIWPKEGAPEPGDTGIREGISPDQAVPAHQLQSV